MAKSKTKFVLDHPQTFLLKKIVDNKKMGWLALVNCLLIVSKMFQKLF